MTQDKNNTPTLQALLHAEPDLVDKIFEFIFSDPDMAKAVKMISDEGGDLDIASKKLAVKAFFKGSRAYVTDRKDVAYQVLSQFNGRNATEIARKLQIGRATVYRLLKQPGQSIKR